MIINCDDGKSNRQASPKHYPGGIKVSYVCVS